MMAATKERAKSPRLADWQLEAAQEDLRKALLLIFNADESPELWDEASLEAFKRYSDRYDFYAEALEDLSNPEWIWNLVESMRVLADYTRERRRPREVHAVTSPIHKILKQPYFQSYLDAIALNKNTLPPLVE